MKTFNTSIATGTLTGKSGINLDEQGYIKNRNNIICWVVDGVSPILFCRGHAWQFKRFWHASKLLNNAFQCENWANIHCSFKLIVKKLKTQDKSTTFLNGPFYHWPLFSCGLVKIDFKYNTIELAIYGDCIIIIEKDCKFKNYCYEELEKKKEKINKLFNVFDKYIHTIVSGYLKKIIFSLIRAQQIWFGISRVYSIYKYYPPAISEFVELKDVNRIVIISDGVSWYLKKNIHNTSRLMEALSKNGVEKTLIWLRSLEGQNSDFGRYDDATIAVINLEEQRHE